MAGENYHYRRLIRCRGAAGEGGWEVTTAPAQHGIYVPSGQSKPGESSRGNPSRTGLVGSIVIMVFFQLGFIKMLPEFSKQFGLNFILNKITSAKAPSSEVHQKQLLY